MKQLQLSGAWAIVWKTKILAPVGFWRSLCEVTAAALFFSNLPYANRSDNVVLHLLGCLTYGTYAWGAWRLESGSGSWKRRFARIISWCLLLTVAFSAFSWMIWKIIPSPQLFMGTRLPEFSKAPFGTVLVNSVVVISSMFLTTRLMIVLARVGRTRLRWQMIYTYLAVGIATTVLVPLVANFYIGVVSLYVVPPDIDPADAANRAAQTIRPLILRPSGSQSLSNVLASLVNGTLRLPLPAGERADNRESRFSLQGVRRMTVLRPDGTVLASAGEQPFGLDKMLPPADAARFQLLLHSAAPGAAVGGRPVSGPNADTGASVITDDRANPIAYVLVENHVTEIQQMAAGLNRMAVVVMLGTVTGIPLLLLMVSAVLLISGGFGYLLARRVTQPIERLAMATETLAAGEDPPYLTVGRDEIGRLSAGFNTMASRLRDREQALQGARDQAQRLLEANRRLIADVSHELRTPLATLRGYIETIELEHAGELPETDLAVIHREIQRLTALIDDLFTVARTEAGQLQLTIEPFDLGAVVQRLTDSLGPLARRERQVELITLLPPGLPQVMADRARIEQVCLNLVQNALRYTPPGGIVAFEAASDAASVILTVADTGIGISAEELPYVFDRFYRGDSSRDRETGGAGLGLSLVRELTTAMGGSVSVESSPGTGSRFQITLCRAG